jgi:isopenicillin N synthase-like dioxygenase
MDVSALRTDGFVSIQYPQPLRYAMHEAMESWIRFCTLPTEQKRLLSGGDRIKDFGYMRREDTDTFADEKELFHSVRAYFPLLLPKAELVGDSRATNFITAIDTLTLQMSALVRTFAGEVEDRYKIPDFAKLTMDSADYWTFRYLRYPKGKPVLANPHADRGGMTFHLGETEGGGEYLDFDHKWRPWLVSEKETIFFPSMGLQHCSKGKLKALWHRVVPVESPANERYAMVAFIDFQNSHRFDDSKFRMQKFEPGFNYKMQFDKFDELFVPRLEWLPG